MQLSENCRAKTQVTSLSAILSHLLRDLLGSVHIPAVLCYALVSTCSNILNVYVASCFFHKHVHLHRVCLYDPIELNKHNFIIPTIIISNVKFVYHVLLFQGCLLDLHCIHFLKILLVVFY